ncbi:MAG: hypothetical protein MUF81_12505 [Verrucomicrobia bacterium]|jgi:hypothetical protein|nr:hypothetical protein [Verrucomicrobiota bacterium]
MPTALELLDKFAAAQEPLKSFIAVEEFAGRVNGISQAVDGNLGSTNEVRVDGFRVVERSWEWGPQGGTRNRPKYWSILTDGRKISYNEQPAPGELVIMPESVGWFFRSDPKKRMAESMGRSFLRQGFGVIHPGDRRIDLRLRAAQDLRLRPKLELAGWEPSPCYVLEGETETGRYTLWLDPAHGYHLAREVAERRPEHLGPNGRPCGEHAVSTVEKVRFEMRDGLWLPVEISSRMEGPYQGRPTLQTFHTKVTRFTLNPNHAALRSFVPDDVRDGTQVILVGENRRTKATGTWRAGRAVDSAGTVLWTPESLAGTVANKHPQPVP